MPSHEIDFLLQGQSPQQIGNASIIAQLWIAEWIIRLRARFEYGEGKNKKQRRELFFCFHSVASLTPDYSMIHESTSLEIATGLFHEIRLIWGRASFCPRMTFAREPRAPLCRPEISLSDFVVFT